MIQKIERNYRFVDQPHRLNWYANYIVRFVLRNQLTYQYLIVAAKQMPETISRDNLV